MRNKILLHCAGLSLSLLALIQAGPALGQDDRPVEERVIGVWRMDQRILYSPGVKYIQEEGSVSITEQMPDGKFRVMSRVTTRAVADFENAILRPGCEGKMECTYDDATEGIGVVFRNTIYIDWIDEGWIDDLLTIRGNVMTGDDGNGPIRLVREE